MRILFGPEVELMCALESGQPPLRILEDPVQHDPFFIKVCGLGGVDHELEASRIIALKVIQELGSRTESGSAFRGEV
jgi:hypothetical protein